MDTKQQDSLSNVVSCLSMPLSTGFIFLVFIAIDFPYQYGFRYQPLFESLAFTLLDAAMFSVLLWVTTRTDLARVTLCFLALPYLIFISGWLNLPTAFIFGSIFIFCITRTLRATQSCSNPVINTHDLVSFVLIIIWVNLSGAGGYGYQTSDYSIHNARLKDLVDYTWPVRYGEDQNFVFYFGYFLPSAIIGKLSNTELAFRSMYPWTILGITLALRWLSVLSGWRFSALLIIVFILFGPLDILNIVILDNYADISFNSGFAEILVNNDYLDFRTRYDIGFIIGNYLSNSFQFFWSPHQVIAGWLCISLMTYLFLKKQTTQLVFIYALLCLWSPLIMIALFPFVLVIAVTQLLAKQWSNILTLENTLGASAITVIFVIFYLGGSPETIPSPFILNGFDWKHKGWVLALFYVSAWGIYSISLTPCMAQQEHQKIIWFICLLCTLLLLPLKKFGAYSDLLCRGSAPLMFLLLVFILQAIRYYWQQKQYAISALLLCMILLGSGSSLLQLRNAINLYGETSASGNIVDYIYATENLGPDDTLFNQYLRKKPQEKSTKE